MLAGGGERPFFSIGVPTYNRHELLRETLASVLAQEFGDFEVIVGNDYTAETLDAETIGLCDPRIRFVNHPENLREVGNMNALLGQAQGRYFTWLFDDDLFEPNFLQIAHDRLKEAGFPPAFFASYRMLKVGEPFRPGRPEPGPLQELTGREFLRRYSPFRPAVGSTCGLFDTQRLREVVGGVEELSSSPIGIYCEYLFLVKCALLGKLLFVDAPLYVYRRHAESWSESNLEMETHLAAGRELVRRCAAVLRHPSLAEELAPTLVKICQIHLITFAYKSARFEYGRARVGVAAVCRALGRHRQESRATRKLCAAQGAGAPLRGRVAFFKVDLISYYLILRLFANHWIRGRRGGR